MIIKTEIINEHGETETRSYTEGETPNYTPTHEIIKKNLTPLFELRKKNILNDRGYYFKGEFLSHYKSRALDILRARIQKDNEWREGYKNTDEYKVLNEEYLKSCEKTRKTYEKKKGYYDALKNNSNLRKKTLLELKIKQLENKKQNVVLYYDSKIKAVIEELKGL